MSGIVGLEAINNKELVTRMLSAISHRGMAWQEIQENGIGTIGFNGFRNQSDALTEFQRSGLAKDGCVPGRFAQALMDSNRIKIKRDALGAAPMYYGWTPDNIFCFASEAKAMIVATKEFYELPPGQSFDGKKFEPYFKLGNLESTNDSIDVITKKLRRKLEESIEKSIGDGNVGSWLSGGLDSSIMAALARKRVHKLHTFAAGLQGAPDLHFARLMANHIDSDHHEIIVSIDTILSVLPEVIYALESFDALLVRSSILNYIVARYAAKYVPAVFSGEGGDELFAGYAYLKGMDASNLDHELVDIIGRLHNTALQRVDRCASAHGTLPHVGFLDPDVVDYALRIPTDFKLHEGIEKWILRQSVADLLPAEILNRTKAKFWEGGGFNEVLSGYAENQIGNEEFESERALSNGWILNTKEELMYYRIFKTYFSDLKNLDWMGRTKGAPQS